MSNIDQLSSLFESEISNIDLPKEPSNLYDPIRYILEAGGKRIRPIMLLTAAEIYGGDISRAIYGALALEVFHNFTLLHDDIMDNAEVRRARATVHKKWNENIAILSGDAMVIHSYNLLGKCSSDRFGEILGSFNTLAALVCEGQQLDMDFESKESVTIEEYIQMITLKTSALIAGAFEIGAIIGGANSDNCQKIYEFGINLGIAFQLQDDLLDTFGDEKKFGKRIGGDILEKKKTFLLLTALKISDPKLREELIATLNNDNLENNTKIDQVKNIYNQLEIKSIAQKEIELYMAKSLAYIEQLDIDENGKSMLYEIANRLVNRDK